jgi:hypothetical protein
MLHLEVEVESQKRQNKKPQKWEVLVVEPSASTNSMLVMKSRYLSPRKKRKLISLNTWKKIIGRLESKIFLISFREGSKNRYAKKLWMNLLRLKFLL